MNDDLKKLYSPDQLDLILYCLYRLSGDDKYSMLSKLAYTVDEKSFVNLISMFSGQTIKIPTKEELQNVLNAFNLYIAVNLNKSNDLNNIISKMSLKTSKSVEELLNLYLKLNDFIESNKLKTGPLQWLKDYLELLERDLSFIENGQGLKQKVAERLEKTNRRYKEELERSISSLSSYEVMKETKRRE